MPGIGVPRSRERNAAGRENVADGICRSDAERWQNTTPEFKAAPSSPRGVSPGVVLWVAVLCHPHGAFLGRVPGEGVGDEGRMWRLRKRGRAELSGRAQENTVVSSALQRPFGASDHRAGASLKGLGLVLAPLGPPAATLHPYLVSF